MKKYMMCLFYDDIYLSKFDDVTEERLLKDLYQLGNYVILEGMSIGKPIPTQIKIYNGLLKEMADRRREDKGIWRDNHQLIVSSIGALLKLKQYTEDELLCVLKKPKKKYLNTKLKQ